VLWNSFGRGQWRKPASRIFSSSWPTISAGSNVSAYNLGVMGYRTPNIDKIGREGAIFTDFYGQQSCTAGRAAFMTGQTPIRTEEPEYENYPKDQID
jgi:hypothetical protein